MAAFFLTLFSAPVMAAKIASEQKTEGTTSLLTLTLGKGEIVTVPAAVADIMVADPKIADVSALQSDKLYIVGASVGDTNIMILDNSGNLIRRLNVHVKVDTVALEAMIADIFPNEDVNVHMIGNHIALTGKVSNPSVAQKVTRLVAAHMGEVNKRASSNVDDLIENLLEVRGEQQVMLRVRILEMSRAALRELGNDVRTANPDASSGRFLSGNITSNSNTGLIGDPFTQGSLLLGADIAGFGDLQLFINALEQDNLASTLAEPNLTAISGEEAGFLAGGEFPVPTGRDNQGNVIIDFKQFGVSLNFKPVVLSEDRISMQMNTEVSALNPGQGIVLEDLTVPGLDVRRASTTVEMNSGGSLMIAGLLQSNNVKGFSGLPGIKDTPVIGELLKSRSFQRNETEMVVIVTPYLVSPYADTAQAQPIAASALNDVPPPPPPAGLMPTSKGKMAHGKTENRKPVPVEKVVAVEPEELPQDQPVRVNTPLNKVFSKNMKSIYGKKIGNIPAENQSFGYMMD